MSPALWKLDNGDVLYLSTFYYHAIYSFTYAGKNILQEFCISVFILIRCPEAVQNYPDARRTEEQQHCWVIMGVLTTPLPGKRKQQNHPYASVAGLGWLYLVPNTLPIFYHRRFGNRPHNIHSCSRILDNILNIHHRLSVSVSLPLC